MNFQERPKHFRSGLMAVPVEIEMLENETGNKVDKRMTKCQLLDGLERET